MLVAIITAAGQVIAGNVGAGLFGLGRNAPALSLKGGLTFCTGIGNSTGEIPFRLGIFSSIGGLKRKLSLQVPEGKPAFPTWRRGIGDAGSRLEGIRYESASNTVVDDSRNCRSRKSAAAGS